MAITRNHWPVLRLGVMVLIAGIALAAGISFGIAKDRNVLWRIIHTQCVPDQRAHGHPAPCAHVDLTHGMRRGYAILKDIDGIAQFLLIPTRRISGIESPALLAPRAPNYFAAAWRNRHFVSARLARPLGWDEIGLAINSSAARSQDQLHIHIDCLRPDVRAKLAAHRHEIGWRWSKLSFSLAGRHYFARRLGAAQLARHNPFKLLAFGLRDARRHMAQETLAVVGLDFAHGRKGFVLLARRAGPMERLPAHAEALLDHNCALAQPWPAWL